MEAQAQMRPNPPRSWSYLGASMVKGGTPSFRESWRLTRGSEKTHHKQIEPGPPKDFIVGPSLIIGNIWNSTMLQVHHVNFLFTLHFLKLLDIWESQVALGVRVEICQKLRNSGENHNYTQPNKKTEFMRWCVWSRAVLEQNLPWNKSTRWGVSVDLEGPLSIQHLLQTPNMIPKRIEKTHLICAYVKKNNIFTCVT